MTWISENLHQHVTSDYLENANSPSQVESFISFGRESLKSLNLRLFASDSSEVTWLETRDSRLILPCFCSSSANMKKNILTLLNYCLPSFLGRHCRDRQKIQRGSERFMTRDEGSSPETTRKQYDYMFLNNRQHVWPVSTQFLQPQCLHTLAVSRRPR